MASYLVLGKTLVFAGGVASPPHNKLYTMEYGPNAKEIEMGTTAESFDFTFFIYIYAK